MANLKRVRCSWGGSGTVGPSVTTFYFSSTASGFSAALQTFFQAIKADLPNNCTVTVPNTGDLVRETDGVLQGVWTDSGGSTTTGTDSGAFQRGSGFRIEWVTAGIRNGRRVTGTSFVVPACSLAFDTDGFLGAATAAAVTTAASALLSSTTPDFLVWSKPHSKAAADGSSHPVLGVNVPLEPTQLRSRRV